VPLFFSALDKQHDKNGFDSGVVELDTYLKAQAGQDVKRNLSSVFVLSENKSDVIGYYTLSQYSLAVEDFPGKVAKKLPSKRKIACTLLGRLAVDKRFRNLGYGSSLLYHALLKTVAISKEIASFAVIVEAKDEKAKRFYQKHDFLELEDAPLRLFITVKGIEQKLGSYQAAT
jgi:GNAT superfamily N-acetyltransferase